MISYLKVSKVMSHVSFLQLVPQEEVRFKAWEGLHATEGSDEPLLAWARRSPSYEEWGQPLIKSDLSLADSQPEMEMPDSQPEFCQQPKWGGSTFFPRAELSWYPDISLVRPHQENRTESTTKPTRTSDLQNCEMIHGHCFNLLNCGNLLCATEN